MNAAYAEQSLPFVVPPAAEVPTCRFAKGFREVDDYHIKRAVKFVGVAQSSSAFDISVGDDGLFGQSAPDRAMSSSSSQQAPDSASVLHRAGRATPKAKGVRTRRPGSFPIAAKVSRRDSEQPGAFEMKMLLAGHEAGCIVGTGGAEIQRMQQQTGTRMHFSGRRDFYPETSLQKLEIRGPSPGKVLAAVWCVLETIGRQHCATSGDYVGMGSGKANLRIVVPCTAASMLASSGVRIELLESTASWEPQEAIVRLWGTLTEVYQAIVVIAECLSHHMHE